MPKKYALIIGIENYPPESGQENVPYAINDCKAMAEYFEKDAGFRLDKLLLDEKAGYKEIVKAMEDLFYYVEPEDWVAIYYAGHGHYSEYGGYLIPHSYRKGESFNESTCVSFESINRRLKAKKPKNFVFLLDTCHSGMALGEIGLRKGEGSDSDRAIAMVAKQIEKEFDEMVQGKNVGRVLFASCNPKEKSHSEKAFEHGLFTHFLLQGLSGGCRTIKGHVNIEELIPWVKDQVIMYSKKRNFRQTPTAKTHVENSFLLPVRKKDFSCFDDVLGRAVSHIQNSTPSPYGTKGVNQRFVKGSIYTITKRGISPMTCPEVKAGDSFRITYLNIGMRYESYGGTGSKLGFPLSEIKRAWDNKYRTDFTTKGYIQWFEGGNIYFSERYGAHVMWAGNIREKFEKYEHDLIKWANNYMTGGIIGFPVSELLEVKSLTGAIGAVQRFQSGIIIDWSAGTFGIVMGFFDIYQSIGEWKSPLGFPLSDEYSCKSELSGIKGAIQDFEDGCMIWNHKNNKGFYIFGEIYQKWNENRLIAGFPLNIAYVVDDYLVQDFEGGAFKQYNKTGEILFEASLDRDYSEDKNKESVKEISSKEELISSKPKEIDRDGYFIAYDDGTVRDEKNGLMWAAADNGKNINWQGAFNWCENYKCGGYTDWRMPTIYELKGLYDKNNGYPMECSKKQIVHVTRLIHISCWLVWASDKYSSTADYLNFCNGHQLSYERSASDVRRALPVRNAK